MCERVWGLESAFEDSQKGVPELILFTINHQSFNHIMSGVISQTGEEHYKVLN